MKLKFSFLIIFLTFSCKSLKNSDLNEISNNQHDVFVMIKSELADKIFAALVAADESLNTKSEGKNSKGHASNYTVSRASCIFSVPEDPEQSSCSFIAKNGNDHASGMFADGDLDIKLRRTIGNLRKSAGLERYYSTGKGSKVADLELVDSFCKETGWIFKAHECFFQADPGAVKAEKERLEKNLKK